MPNHKFIVIEDFEDFDVSHFNYQANDQAKPDLEVRYSNNLKIYFKTPVLELGEICQYQGDDYLDLQIPDSFSSDFRDYLVTLDQYHLAQVEVNQKLWGYDGSVKQTVLLSQRFRNLLNFSSKSRREFILVKFDQHPKLFDQYDNRITLAELQPGQKTRAILELEGLFTQDGEVFYTKLNLVQLKTRVPENSEVESSKINQTTKSVKSDVKFEKSDVKIEKSDAKSEKSDAKIAKFEKSDAKIAKFEKMDAKIAIFEKSDATDLVAEIDQVPEPKKVETKPIKHV